MEPVAVRAGLWRWSEPGLFDVWVAPSATAGTPALLRLSAAV